MTILKLFKPFAKVPFIKLVKALTLLASLSTKGAIAVQQIPKKLRKNSTFQLVPINRLPGFTKIAETQGGIENIALPKIVGLSNGGSISVNMPGDYLCKLNNVSFVPYSDFIRDEHGHVANEKLFRKEYDVLIPRDRDMSEIKGKIIRLSNKKDKIHSKVAFNLMGTYSHNWAHFLAQYYPKMSFLNDLPKLEEIDLIIPKNTDPHIKYLIEYELNNYPHIGILEVDIESEIVCEKLYHVSLGTFLGDDGYFPTPFAILISNSTIKFWNKKAMELVPKDAKQYRRIFIGRTGFRNLKNYNEVLDFFIDKGFEEIFPHLLNIEEKIKIFSEAKYIVGPASSGFTNSIYSQSGTKILAFINSFRYLDTLLAGFSNYKKQENWIMTGKDDNLNNMNSSYEISLNEIKLFLEKNKFLDNQDEVVNK
jgi:capsular polysaccharide biosynthesis protein